MPGIEAKVMYHKLHIVKNFKPMKQKPRRTASKNAKSMEEEVQKSLKAGAQVVVKKNNEK